MPQRQPMERRTDMDVRGLSQCVMLVAAWQYCAADDATLIDEAFVIDPEASLLVEVTDEVIEVEEPAVINGGIRLVGIDQVSVEGESVGDDAIGDDVIAQHNPRAIE